MFLSFSSFHSWNVTNTNYIWQIKGRRITFSLAQLKCEVSGWYSWARNLVNNIKWIKQSNDYSAQEMWWGKHILTAIAISHPLRKCHHLSCHMHDGSLPSHRQAVGAKGWVDVRQVNCVPTQLLYGACSIPSNLPLSLALTLTPQSK
jgi:hypothetical protein